MDRLENGTRVKTLKNAGSKDWTDMKRPDVQWGVLGTITKHSDSHGLIYYVDHDGWGGAWYEPEELEDISLSNLPVVLHRVESRVGKPSEKLREEFLDKEISPEKIIELAKEFDLMVICRKGQIQVWIDKQGYRWRQM